MKKIKYKLSSDFPYMKCLTKCPYSKKLPYDPIYVGSSGCVTVCEYFVNENSKQHIVTCNYKDENK